MEEAGAGEQLRPGLESATRDYDAVVAERDAAIVERDRLRVTLAERDAALASALDRIAELEFALAKLEARLGISSSNSSLPPSKNPLHVKRGRKSEPTGKPAGGQKGHEPHHFAAVDPADVDRKIACPPAERCDYCQADLRDGPLVLGEPAAPFYRFDLPPLKLDVTAYLRPRRHCEHCDRFTVAPLPAGVGPSPFGPGLVSFIAMATIRYRLGRRPMSDLLAELFGRRISTGAIQSALELASEAIAAAVAAIKDAIESAPAVNADETGWRDQSGFAKGKKSWLWVALTPTGTLFAIAPGRDIAGSLRVLGEKFAGIVMCDRWRPYESRFASDRQLCWAHIDREAVAAVDRGRILATKTDAKLVFRGNQLVAWGTAFGAEIDRMFKLWHAFKDGALSRAELADAIAPVKTEIAGLLARGERGDDPKVAGTCRDLLRQFECLWTFVTVEGVEPTNNAGERELRPAVILRRLMISTKSEAGRNLLTRLMSVLATCKKQGINALAYLKLAIEHHVSGLPPPLLLPG